MIGKITIGTIWDAIPESSVGVYIGRSSKQPSVLGNPFVINASRTREEACEQYEEYLMDKMNQGDREVLTELNRIGSILLSGKDVLLRCYCKNRLCHGEFIEEVIMDHILEYQAELDDAITNKVLG